MPWVENGQPFRKIPVRVVEDQGMSQLSAQPQAAWEETGESSLDASSAGPAVGAENPDWRSLALRMQAEMDNFRRRQTRRADDTIMAERERLLRGLLPIADNLARSLRYDGPECESLRKGVELTYRELSRFLEAEGVARIEAKGQPFTPELHEAVASVVAQAKPGMVVEELETGYQLKGKLLRPARVLVSA